jgi:uncharacterized oxidoreductase
MTASKETILITGGSSGIGLGLAKAFHARGAKVIIAGRSQDRLQAVAEIHPGMATEQVDVSDAKSVALFAERIHATYPALNMLINNAGIQQLLDFSGTSQPTDEMIASEINTNLTGLIQVTKALLPLLKAQASARLVHVGSGLAYIPLVAAPIYSATKAAVHSFTISLRKQMTNTNVQVIEIIPPVVETNLHAGQTRQPPGAMQLAKFVDAAIKGLDAGKDEVVVGLANGLRIGHRLAPGLFMKIVNKGSA